MLHLSIIIAAETRMSTYHKRQIGQFQINQGAILTQDLSDMNNMLTNIVTLFDEDCIEYIQLYEWTFYGSHWPADSRSCSQISAEIIIYAVMEKCVKMNTLYLWSNG